jgi:hypothetical protein
MDRLEYNFNGNEIGLSIKRPDADHLGKWSNSYMELECENCGSTDLRSSATGEGFMLACMDCPNFNCGVLRDVAHYHRSEEAYTQEPDCFTRIDT